MFTLSYMQRPFLKRHKAAHIKITLAQTPSCVFREDPGLAGFRITPFTLMYVFVFISTHLPVELASFFGFMPFLYTLLLLIRIERTKSPESN
jgi:hypothetical protein